MESVGDRDRNGIVEYLSGVRFAKAPKIAIRLREAGLPDASLDSVKPRLVSLCASGALVETPGGLYCLPEHQKAALEQERRKLSPTTQRPRSHGGGVILPTGPGLADAPKRRPALRRTELSGPVVAGGPGVCDKCGCISPARDKVDHTTWGVVSLCPRCIVEVCARPRIKRHVPFIRVISAPIGSGKHR